MDRPIVVNSLLCFIHNYRHSLVPEQLKALLHNYFSKSARSMAHATLTELLSSVSLPETAAATYPADTTDPDDHTDNDSDLLYLYDRITSSEQSPVFVAADLNILPLQLITDKDDSKSELLREIRQLKRFIQDALNGRVDEPPITQADSGVQTVTEKQSDSDLHGHSSSCLASPKSSFKSSTNVSTSSPELPASTSSISSTPCSSFIPTTMASPTSPYHHMENNQNMIGSSNSIFGSTFPSNDNNTLSNGNNRDGSSTNCITNINNHNRRKRDGCGNRLDAMVRKLANRQKEKEAAAAAAATTLLTGGSSGTGISLCSGSALSSSSSSLSSFSTITTVTTSTAATTTTLPTPTTTMATTTPTLTIPSEHSSSPAKTIWHTQMIDPIAYVNMLRTMSGAAAAAAVTAISSPSSIFPSINKTIHSDRSKSDSLTEFGDNLEDGSIEMGEKNSNESSPSPSDSSNNVDEATYTAADLAEKPFTCEHTNCHKRFANKFLLKKHQFIHTGLRPHCCPFCGKRFNRKDNLLRHKKTHIANALGTDITSALSSDDFLLRLGADKPTIKLDNEQEEESEI